MELTPSINNYESDVNAPFWTKVGSPRPEKEEGDRVAFLDIYEPTYLPVMREFSNEDLQLYREAGLNEDGEYALCNGFGAGCMYDLNEFARQAITEGGFTGIQTLPNTDSGPRQIAACPYISGMFGKDPKDVDLLAIPGLNSSNSEFINLINERGKQMLEDEKRICNNNRYHHSNLRVFKLDALWIAYDYMMYRTEDMKFEEYLDEHVQDGDRLLDYAVTIYLQGSMGKPWQEWPEDMAIKKPIDHINENNSLRQEVRRIMFAQWIISQQWDKYADNIKSVGGHHVEDRAYAVSEDSPEVLRDWREQYFEGKEGIFHIGRDRKKILITGVNVAGDPYGPQAWGHVVAKYRENPVGMADYIIETLVQDDGRVDVRRIDHALAWIWKYYVIQHGESAENGEYIDALKEQIFNRLRERFPDTYFIIEDVGYTHTDVDKTMEWLGVGPFKSFKWAPGEDGSLDPKYKSPSSSEFSSTELDDNHDLASFEVWFCGLSMENKRYYLGEIYGEGNIDERYKMHVINGERHEVPAMLTWVFKSRAHIAITTLQSMGNAVVADDRSENTPGVETPDFWQLTSRLGKEYLSDVFNMTRGIIKETKRSVREILDQEELQILAVSQRPGQGQYVPQCGTYSLSIACNRPPSLNSNINLNSYVSHSEGEPNEKSLGDASIVSCVKYKDGTYVWNVEAKVSADAEPWSVIGMCPSITEGDNVASLFKDSDRLFLQVQPA